MTDLKTYTNKSNANRAAKRIIGTLPEGTTVTVEAVDSDYTLHFRFDAAQATLTPDQRSAVEGFRCSYPLPPSPDEPLLPPQNMKPYDQWDRSKADTPVAVCYEAFEQAFAEQGHDYDKPAIVATLVAAGVAANTVHGAHRDWRTKVRGWPLSRKQHRKELGLD